MGSVIIIGGGAAGMSAAIAAAMCGDRVTVLERMDRVGRKLLATGNGRCNLMNTGEPRFPGGDGLARQVLARMGQQEQRRFWETLGLRLRQEDGGRVYPVSNAASSVLDTLRQAMRLLSIEVVTEADVDGLSPSRKGWLVTSGERRWTAQRVIVAGGGCAQPKLGSNGSAWPLLTALGHRMVSVQPALTQMITDTAPIRGLSGIRVRCGVRVTDGTGEKYRESGEVLFADYGVSGVCVMQCARFASPGDTFHIDLTQAMGFDGPRQLHAELRRRLSLWADSPQMTRLDLLTGLCVPKLAIALMRGAGIERAQELPAADLTAAQLNRLVQLAADFCLTVRGVKGFDSAQVTAGGVDTAEFDPETMVSRLAPGVHAAGEVLDVDGDCGGFNLMFAFGSGLLAGLNGRPCPW